MNRIHTVVLAGLSAVLYSVTVASAVLAAPIPGLYNTGVDDFGIPLANLETSIDTHYTISPNPDAGGSDGLTHVEDESVFPFGVWIANTPTSKWVAPRFNTAGSAAGDYAYNLSFNLANVDLTSATISGRWAVDNGNPDSAPFGVFLNGTKVAPANSAGFGTFTDFTIPTGSPFVDGENVLSFRFSNGGVGYTGLQVTDLVGSATEVAPEPSSLLMLGLGALVLGRRNRKSVKNG